MIESTHRDVARTWHLPGREWRLLLGPQNSATDQLTLSIATFPPASAPAGHIHAVEEEMVYVLRGRGRLLSADAIVELRPGTALRIPAGIEHGAVNDGDEPLELLCVFTPPVTPGSYEPTDGTTRAATPG
jgi:quercetin dioxygenase-like cupin family protein